MKPDRLRFGKGETDAAVLEHGGVACHRMRTTDDAVSNTIGSRESSQIQTSLELVRLDADQGQQSGLLRITDEIEIIEIRLDIFVYRMGLDFDTID